MIGVLLNIYIDKSSTTKRKKVNVLAMDEVFLVAMHLSLCCRNTKYSCLSRFVYLFIEILEKK